MQFSSLQPLSAHSDIINSPKLAGELQGIKLGSLLPPKQIRLLEATFLSNELVSPATAPGPGQGRGRKETKGRLRDRQDMGRELDRDFHVGRADAFLATLT